jgi:hypothetical protein
MTLKGLTYFDFQNHAVFADLTATEPPTKFYRASDLPDKCRAEAGRVLINPPRMEVGFSQKADISGAKVNVH